MGKSRIAAVLTLLLLAQANCVAAAEPVAVAAVPVAVTVPNSLQWDFTSAVNGKKYRVQIALPVGPPPTAGYPVIYVTDGGGFFGTFSDMTRVRGLGGELPPVVVVGITYPDDDILMQFTRRYLDLTQSDADAETKSRNAAAPGGSRTEYGGADAFLKVIETEIAPKVAATVKIDRQHTTLYGHSLGGLFTLHVLFTRHDAFQTYLISSPSIWWNNRDVLKEEAAFSDAVRAGNVASRVLILVGGDEQTLPNPPYPPGMTKGTLQTMINSAAMIDNAESLASRLTTLHGAPGYLVQAKVYAGESHLSVPFASLSTLAKFALPH